MNNTSDQPLTAKQQLFVTEYVKRGNATEAALAVGYAPKSAQVSAARLLDPDLHPHVVASVQRELDKKRTEAHVSSQQVVAELAKIAFMNPKRLFAVDNSLLDMKDIPDEVAVCIKDFKVSYRVGVDMDGKPIKIRTVEVKFWDKLDALRQIAQHLGLLKDVLNVNTQINLIDWNGLLQLKAPHQDLIEQQIIDASTVTPDVVEE